MVKEKLKGLSKDALIYGAGDALGRLIGLIMLPILSRIFGPADYGAIDLLTISLTFVAGMLTLGVPTGVQRYYFQGDERDRNTLVTSCMVFMLVVAVIGGAVVALLADPISHAVGGTPETLRSAVLWIAFLLPVQQMWTYQVLILRMQRRAVTFSMANIGLVVLTPLFTFWFVAGLRMEITGVFFARTLAVLIVTLGLVPATRGIFNGVLRWSVMRDVVRFAVPGLPGTLIRQSLVVVPRYMLAYFAPLTAVGLLGIASRIATLVRVFIEAFNRAWNPFAYANEGSPDERRIYEVVLKAMFTILVILSLGLSVLAPEVIALLTPPGYEAAAVLVPGVVVALALDGIVLILSTILYTRNRVRWSSYLGALELFVLLAAGLALVPAYQAGGLVVALVLASTVFFVAYLLSAQKLFRFSVPVFRLLTLTFAAVAVGTALLALELPVLASLAVKIPALLVFAALAVLFTLSATERSRIGAMLGRRA